MTENDCLVPNTRNQNELLEVVIIFNKITNLN